MLDPFNVSVKWKEKVQFTATNDKTDFDVAIDVPNADQGGEKKGTTPKHLFLQAIGGCTGQIVIMLLAKMKAQMPSKFSVDITGQLTPEHPMYFDTISITYNVEGNTDGDTLKKVIEMSDQQFCGLTFMVNKVAQINYHLLLNGEHIDL